MRIVVPVYFCVRAGKAGSTFRTSIAPVNARHWAVMGQVIEVQNLDFIQAWSETEIRTEIRAGYQGESVKDLT